MDELRKTFVAAGISAEHIEVWVTADNLMVKKVEQIQSKAGEIRTTAVYSDYGTPVTTAAPGEGDTVDFTELAAGTTG
ncbi:hypothetical protein ACFV1L_26630 [Kitasatospora sp. NPDC059646]|uniref:hypothetical protein n=1 Tax=Kitasatospora sp. NPDC059646 TaxID=3346893 RepID=UPI0036CB8825